MMSSKPNYQYIDADTADELSLETTVPTDLSLSPDPEDISRDYDYNSAATGSKKKYISRQFYERKQILHDMQLLKIELSQKSLIIDNLKADHMQKVEELEEKLSDALHKKQFLQAKLESELSIQQDDAKRKKEQIQRELETILHRQHELESTNERLREKAVDIRKSLMDLELTESQYKDFKLKNPDSLAIKDFVAMKLFETVQPWKTESDKLRSKSKIQGEDLHRLQLQLSNTTEELEHVKQTMAALDLRHQKLSLAYADTKQLVKQGDYKIENYDRVKVERDELDKGFSDLRRDHGYLEAAHQAVTKERDDFSCQLAALKQSLSLTQQDKDYFSKQVSDLQNKLLYMEDRVLQLNDQLDRAKNGREELYDKYVASRDQYKVEYETKLREELEQIRVRTNVEMDRLKTSTREMYERENRGLREARDMAVEEKDHLINTQQEAVSKHEQLMQEYRTLQVASDSRMSELQNEVKLRSFETERTQMVHEETVRTLKECQLDQEKTQAKLEVLRKEYYGQQSAQERRIAELEAILNEKNSKLETYERLEQELDDVVMQAADVDNEKEAERVLFSYGYGANVPTTSKRRLKQSVHLARRVLEIERANTSLRKDLENQTNKNKQLVEELKSATDLMQQAQQPYHYLLEGMRARDAQIRSQKEHLASVEDDLRCKDKERTQLIKSKNEMALDLERLLNQKEEMAVMKQVVLSLSQKHGNLQLNPLTSQRSTSPSSQRTPRSKLGKKSSMGRKQTFEVDFDDNTSKPAPTQFTIKNPPDWYRRQQQEKSTKPVKDRIYKKSS